LRDPCDAERDLRDGFGDGGDGDVDPGALAVGRVEGCTLDVVEVIAAEEGGDGAAGPG